MRRWGLSKSHTRLEGPHVALKAEILGAQSEVSVRAPAAPTGVRLFGDDAMMKHERPPLTRHSVVRLQRRRRSKAFLKSSLCFPSTATRLHTWLHKLQACGSRQYKMFTEAGTPVHSNQSSHILWQGTPLAMNN